MMFDIITNIFKIGAKGSFGWIGFGAKLIPLIALVGLVLWGISNIVSCSAAKLETKIAKQEVIINDLGQANSSLADINVKQKESSKVDLDIVVDVKDKEIKSTKVFNKKEIELSKKIADVNKQFDNSSKTLENEKQKIDSVSSIQIDSLWSSYCDASTNSTQCLKATL